MLLRNGCVCCALRDDLKATLQDLLDRSMRGEMPAFRRIVVETTGLADPIPIIETLLRDPLLRFHVRHERTIVTLDAVLGAGQLSRHAESVRQVAVADRIVLTKADIAGPEETAATVDAARRINPGAALGERRSGTDPLALLAVSGRTVAADRLDETRRWIEAFETAHGRNGHHHHHDDDPDGHDHHHDHEDGVRSLSLRLDGRIDWSAFGVWLSALLHRHGPRILRTKGILDVSDVEGPVVLQAAEHLIHPPVHLPAWPDGERGSRLVFITRDLDPERIRRSLEAFLGAAARVSGRGTAAA